MKNDSGFGLISFLALIPLLLTVAAVIGAAMVLLKADAAAKHECRTQLLQAQNSISNELEKLLAMNAGAKALRIERQAAEAAVVSSAGVPVALAAATAALDWVIAEQTAFAAMQTALITTARLQSNLSPLEASMSVQRKFAATTLALQPTVVGSELRSGSFPLDSSPKDSPTPDYEPSEGFTKEQTMIVTIQFLIEPLFPDWLRSIVDMHGLSLKTTCAASIESDTYTKKGVSRWTAVLKPDKF